MNMRQMVEKHTQMLANIPGLVSLDQPLGWMIIQLEGL